ncbi:MAG: DHH family phosphoesterase, partial [Clostridia bacterium]|nr:DHH family phosphoesterase [Clostridia bacterium]
PEMLPGADFLDRISLVLDHHRINTVEGKVKCVLPEKASCGEIILKLLQEMNVEFDSYLAAALYTAIATDTGCFRYSNTTEETFLAAAFLSPFAEKGDFYRINKVMFETKSKLRIALESYAASNMKLFSKDRVAYLCVTKKIQESLGAQYSDLESLINVLRQLEGVEVAIVAKEREDGVFKVSVRSEAGFDASDFCHSFGGGGHVAAAGCTLLGNEEEISEKLLSEAERRIS